MDVPKPFLVVSFHTYTPTKRIKKKKKKKENMLFKVQSPLLMTALEKVA